LTLHIGYSQTIITPPLDPAPYLAGFGQNRRAESVHDDLYVRALALQQAETQLVLAALDLIGLGRQHCREVEARVNERLPGTRLIIACTHTHHGPDTIGLWGPDPSTSGVDLAYMTDLKTKIVETASAAVAALRPTHLRYGAVQVPGLAKNARDPEILDEELTCLQFVQPDEGTVLATMLIYPCHPEVLWNDNPHITSDYAASLRHKVEADTGGPCLFFVGALGGMMTPDVQDHAFAEAEAMGLSLARAALEVLAGAETTVVTNLAQRCAQYTVPMASPLLEMAVQAGLLTDPRLEGTIETETNLLKIGPAWLVTVPGELLPRLGLALKADLRQAGATIAGLIGLANDELGYILPQAEYIYPENPFEPGDHYEETMSIGPDAGPRLLAAVRGMLST
jgi:hypothetical protein